METNTGKSVKKEPGKTHQGYMKMIVNLFIEVEMIEKDLNIYSLDISFYI